MDELLRQFQVETPELVQRAVDDLLALEREPSDRARLDGAFRAVHTLKGSVALFDLAPLGAALHAAEDWLGEVRAGRAGLGRERLDVLIDLLARSEAWIGGLAAGGALGPEAAADCARLGARLGASAEATPAEAAAAPPGLDGPPDWASAMLAAHPELAEGEPKLLLRYAPDADCFFRGEDPLALLAGVAGLSQLDIARRAPWPPAEVYDPFRCNLVFTAAAETTAEAARAALRLAGKAVDYYRMPAAEAKAEAAAADAGPEPVRGGGERLLRVEPARVDALLDVADALASAVSALGELELQGEAARRLSSRRQALDHLAGEMHAAVLRVRLAPLSRTFERLPRLARDLAARLGKPARLEIEGGEVEADRVVVDALFEPLLHLIRNALDHGVEPPAVRRAAGKPAEARLHIVARARGGELQVVVADDGGGVDLAAVRTRAVERGLLGREAAAALDDAGTLELLFATGFSTAAEVSEVSGRGVGLDAVRRAMEAVGGRVALASDPGRGTTASLTAPVSAVLSRMLLIEVGGEPYAVPLAAVSEVVRLPRERVVAVGAGEAFVWRERTVPLLSLHARLNQATTPPRPEVLRLLLVRGEEGPVAFPVDALPERLSGVVRPLSGLLAGMPGAMGTTLGGDGELMFVLDLEALAR